MRFRTLLATVALLFTLPALAGDKPSPEPEQVCFEVRVIKAPAGFCDKVGLKPARDTALTDAQLRVLLEAAQAHADASVMQFPKVTADSGELTGVKVGEERLFVTGLDATKVKGQTALVPKNTSVYLGDVLTAQGRVSADGRYIHAHVGVTHTRIAGKVELTPVVTQITPIFEGGSAGKPIAFTQYLQAPDVRKEQAERSAIIPVGGTLVVGGWKETAEPEGKKPGTESEVIVLATVRVAKDVAAPAQKVLYKLRNVAAADAAHALNTYLQGKNLTATVIADPPSNNVYVGADEALQKQIATTLEALDREPAQVIANVIVMQVPRGFAARAGLTTDDAGGTAWTLTPREVQMFSELIRNAKERGTIDILSRPQLQVCDNQTGHVQVGQAYPLETPTGVKHVLSGTTLNLTPRVSPDGGSVLLRTNVEVSGATGGTHTTRAVQSTASVAFGHTLVLGGFTVGGGDHSLTGAVRRLLGEQVETLVIITPHRVRPEPLVRPAGWFTK